MSKRTPETSRMGVEDKSATGVMDQDSPEVTDSGDLQPPIETLKESQKNRFAQIDRATLIDIYHQMVLCRRFE